MSNFCLSVYFNGRVSVMNVTYVTKNVNLFRRRKEDRFDGPALGPIVQSVVSLTSSLRIISFTVLADSIYNILIFFADKM